MPNLEKFKDVIGNVKEDSMLWLTINETKPTIIEKCRDCSEFCNKAFLKFEYPVEGKYHLTIQRCQKAGWIISVAMAGSEYASELLKGLDDINFKELKKGENLKEFLDKSEAVKEILSRKKIKI